MYVHMLPPMLVSHILITSAIKCEQDRHPGMEAQRSNWRQVPWEGLVRHHPVSSHPRRVIP